MKRDELIELLQEAAVSSKKPIIIQFDHFNKYLLEEANLSVENKQLIIHPLLEQETV